MAGITLAQVAQLEKDPMKKFMALRILRECKIMERLPFENVSSLTVKAMWWQQLPTGGAWRSLNEGFSSGEDGQFADGQEALYGFGGDITFDAILEKLTNTVKDPVQTQVEGKLKSMSMDWNNVFINGDPAVDPKQFAGLKKRVAALPSRQTVYYAASNAAAHDPLSDAAHARTFLDKWEMGWRYCNGGQVDAIICNEDFIVGFPRIMRYLNMQGLNFDTGKDMFDREFPTYKGKPMIDMGTKKDMSTEIFGYETGGDGTATAAISQFLVSFNTEEGVYGIQLNNLDVYDPLNGGEMESKPSKLKRVDWWNGLATFGQHGVVRLRNLEKLASWT